MKGEAQQQHHHQQQTKKLWHTIVLVMLFARVIVQAAEPVLGCSYSYSEGYILFPEKHYWSDFKGAGSRSAIGEYYVDSQGRTDFGYFKVLNSSSRMGIRHAETSSVAESKERDVSQVQTGKDVEIAGCLSSVSLTDDTVIDTYFYGQDGSESRLKMRSVYTDVRVLQEQEQSYKSYISKYKGKKYGYSLEHFLSSKYEDVEEANAQERITTIERDIEYFTVIRTSEGRVIRIRQELQGLQIPLMFLTFFLTIPALIGLRYLYILYKSKFTAIERARNGAFDKEDEQEEEVAKRKHIGLSLEQKKQLAEMSEEERIKFLKFIQQQRDTHQTSISSPEQFEAQSNQP